jgi:hypothetical protein
MHARKRCQEAGVKPSLKKEDVKQLEPTALAKRALLDAQSANWAPKNAVALSQLS